jgi:uncharacterized phage-like protein YoqJ
LRALAAKTNISSNSKKTKTKAQPTEKADTSKKVTKTFFASPTKTNTYSFFFIDKGKESYTGYKY